LVTVLVIPLDHPFIILQLCIVVRVAKEGRLDILLEHIQRTPLYISMAHHRRSATIPGTMQRVIIVAPSLCALPGGSGAGRTGRRGRR